MAQKFCPGSSFLKQPKPELFSCPSCGTEVEIWSDEAMIACPSCGTDVFRTGGSQSCLDWCAFAKECVGEEKFKTYGKMKAALRKQALIKAMEDSLGSDSRRIRLSKNMADFSEKILTHTEGADPNLVLAAASLYFAGRMTQDSSACCGPQKVHDILKELGYDRSFCESACRLIEGSPDAPGADCEVIHDAVLLVAMKERCISDILDMASLKGSISPVLRTEAAGMIAGQEGLNS